MNPWTKKIKLRLPALLLLLVTILFWSRYDRYEPAGPLLLEAVSLADGTDIRGEVSGAFGHFTLKVPSGGKSARINFGLPFATDYKSIRVRARIKVDGVVTGKFPWNCARLIVTQYDANNKWISGHHGLVAERGTKPWKLHEDVFEILPGAVRADVVLQQSGTAGTAAFDHIEAQPVRIRASFSGWRFVFTASWILLGIFYFPRCRMHRRRFKVLILLNVIAILAGTLMPSDWIIMGSEKIKAATRELHPPQPASESLPHRDVGKAPAPVSLQDRMDWFTGVEIEAHQAGHFILFASLCLLVYLSAAFEKQHPAYYFKVGIDVLLFAAITESLQFLTLDRKAGILDLRTDLYGMATAFVVFLVLLPLIRRFGVKPCSEFDLCGGDS